MCLCDRKYAVRNEHGECELCATMRVMEPVIEALNEGFAKTTNRSDTSTPKKP